MKVNSQEGTCGSASPEPAGLLHRELTAMDDRIGALQRRRSALAGYLAGEGTSIR